MKSLLAASWRARLESSLPSTLPLVSSTSSISSRPSSTSHLNPISSFPSTADSNSNPKSTTSHSPPPQDFAALLSRPTWSVRSLLPSSSSSSSSTSTTATSTTATSTNTNSNNNNDHQNQQQPSIPPSQLHHLLRLSALPLPNSPDEQSSMIATLQSQLHFVRDVQAVDTTGVEPLRSIRDETAEGIREATIGVDQLRDVLAQEDVVGHSRRPRRRRKGPEARGGADAGSPDVAQGWDPLQMASRKAGRYFVVKSGKI